MTRQPLASVTCPAPGCDYGEESGPARFKAGSIKTALRYRNDHLRSCHPGYKPPRGSILDRVHRLD